jgi:hypothetical protein
MKKVASNYFKDFVTEFNSYNDLNKNQNNHYTSKQTNKSNINLLKSELKIAYKILVKQTNY